MSTLSLPGAELAWWMALVVLSCVFALVSHNIAAQREPVSSAKIDINTAQLADLLSLPGMNSIRARSILKEREKRGGFQNVDTLGEVKGVTKAYLKRIEDLIEVKR